MMLAKHHVASNDVEANEWCMSRRLLFQNVELSSVIVPLDQ